VSRDQRRAELAAKSKTEIIAMCRAGIPNHRGGKTTVWGAHPLDQWTKDELISTVLDVMFPSAFILALFPPDHPEDL
jgi:hypothetical protein